MQLRYLYTTIGKCIELRLIKAMTINVRNEYYGQDNFNSITHVIEITPDEVM